MSHRVPELRSIELHRIVVDRIKADPAVLDRARRHVDGWLAQGDAVPREPSERWRQLLDGPRDVLLEILVADTVDACALRQVSPFAGVVSSAERWRILREVG